jgi:hypothetical protein
MQPIYQVFRTVQFCEGWKLASRHLRVERSGERTRAVLRLHPSGAPQMMMTRPMARRPSACAQGN